MPSSFIVNAPSVVSGIVEANPRFVLDIGPGWGKYGLMAREYVRVVQRVDALEVPEGRKPHQDCIYDTVFEGRAESVSDAFLADYELVMLIDVIEHMTKPAGKRFLHVARQSGTPLLVSTPKVFEEQDAVDGNPFERHLSLWAMNDFGGFQHTLDLSTDHSWVLLLRP